MREGRTSPAEPRPAVPALILGKGITALAAVRCLGRRGIPLFVAGASGDIVTRSRWYRRLPGTPANESGRWDLGERLEALEIERMVLLPTSDKWAMAVSRLKPDLAARFPSTVAAPDILEQLVDKGRFAEALARFDLPHPRTSLLREPAAARRIPTEFFEGSFLKPTQSGPFAQVYGAKALWFKDREEALRLVDEAAAKGFELMLQEFIPGPASRHHFVEGFIDRQGRVRGILARRRTRIYPPHFGNSTSTETIPLAEVSGAVETVTRLLEAIGYRGVFSAEFKLDERDGLFKILEVNARPWWFVGFAARCGMDVCDMAYRDALGEPVELVPDYQVGRRCVAPRLDLEAGLPEWRAGRLDLLPFLRSWIGGDQLTLCWDDPRPSLNEILTWSKARLRRKLGW